MTVFTVTELTQAIKKTLEPRFAHLQVKGEVTNLRHQASGHLYFSLKDQDAQISAVLFKGNARNVAKLPKAGDQIVVRGELSLYAPRGSYQIIVRELEHAGVGELLLKLHQLKAELQKQGWFNPELKKPLPKFPKTIGVVTSPTGSVIQDIIHVLKRRYPKFHLILNPVRVQGVEAAPEIAKAIQEFNSHGLADILIVGRGGGSLEDLWPFNERCVAEAIFHSNIPVVSAVGHETDVTIADCVADVRAPTPSAAAEVSVRELTSQMDFLTQAGMRAEQSLRQTIRHSKALLEGMKRQPFFASPYTLLADHFQKMDDVSSDLDHYMQDRVERQELHLAGLQKQLQGLKPSAQINQMKSKLEGFSHSLNKSLEYQLTLWKEKLCHIANHIKAVSPENILQKGYCIPFAEKDHSVMIGARALKKGMKISLRFHDGRAVTQVEEVIPKDNGNT